jgi:hypothetical protein
VTLRVLDMASSALSQSVGGRHMAHTASARSLDRLLLCPYQQKETVRLLCSAPPCSSKLHVGPYPSSSIDIPVAVPLRFHLWLLHRPSEEDNGQFIVNVLGTGIPLARAAAVPTGIRVTGFFKQPSESTKDFRIYSVIGGFLGTQSDPKCAYSFNDFSCVHYACLITDPYSTAWRICTGWAASCSRRGCSACHSSRLRNNVHRYCI